jgi:hypothetical protein
LRLPTPDRCFEDLGTAGNWTKPVSARDSFNLMTVPLTPVANGSTMRLTAKDPHPANCYYLAVAIDKKNNSQMPDQDDEPTVELEALSEEACDVIAIANAAQVPEVSESVPECRPASVNGHDTELPPASDSDSLIEELRDEIRCRFDTNSILQRGIDQLRDKCDDLATQVLDLQKENHKLSTGLRTTQQQLDDARQALMQKEREAQALAAKLEARTGTEKDHVDAADHDEQQTPVHVSCRIKTSGNVQDELVLRDLDGAGPDIHVSGDGSFIVGNSSDCDIQIQSRYISGHHARLVKNQTECIMSDLHSTNGTFVNSCRISKGALRASDIVTFGKHRFRCEIRSVRPSHNDLNEHEYSFNSLTSRIR